MDNNNNLVSFNVMVRPEQITQFAFQQPLENIVKQLSINYSYLEIIEALTKVERDKEAARHQEQLTALKNHFSNKLAALAKPDEKSKTDPEPPEVTATPVTETTKQSFHEIICAYLGCQKRFQAKILTARYCSKSCRDKQYSVQSTEETEITRNCLNSSCKKAFKVFHFGNNKKYCSKACWSRHYRATHKEQYTSYQEKWKSKKVLPQPEQPLEEAERPI